MTLLQELEIKRQKKVVQDALDALELERVTIGFTWESLERHFHYVYSIAFQDGRKRSGHGRPVVQMKGGIVVNIYPDAIEASRAVKKSRGAVGKCLNSGCKTCAGYEWRYLPE